MRILFAGGGSVGHLAPSVAVWESVKNKSPNASALFVCSSKKDDRKFLKTQKVRKASLIAPKGNSLLFIVLFPIAIIQSFLILIIFRPHVIFSKGGYVSVPICLIGWAFRIPIVLHESDRVMGRANKFLMKFANHLCIGTPQKEISDDDVMTNLSIDITATGNPIREKILTGSSDGGKRVTGFSGKRPVLLIIGGSQGASTINEIIWNALDSLVDICDIVHLTGRGKMNPKKSHGRYFQSESSYEEIHNIYAIADVVLSRAGAGTIAELSSLGKATILIPIPKLASGHQEENAHFMQVAGAAVVIDQNNLNRTLISTIKMLVEDEIKRKALSERFRSFADPDAADRIANILLVTANK